MKTLPKRNPEDELGFAARHGDTATVRTLLLAGVAPDPKGNSVSALMVACEGGYTEIAILLLDAGADANHCNRAGETALHYAVWSKDPQLIRLLLARGADPMAATIEKGNTPSLYAAWNGYCEVEEALLEAMQP